MCQLNLMMVTPSLAAMKCFMYFLPLWELGSVPMHFFKPSRSLSHQICWHWPRQWKHCELRRDISPDVSLSASLLSFWVKIKVRSWTWILVSLVTDGKLEIYFHGWAGTSAMWLRFVRSGINLPPVSQSAKEPIQGGTNMRQKSPELTYINILHRDDPD